MTPMISWPSSPQANSEGAGAISMIAAKARKPRCHNVGIIFSVKRLPTTALRNGRNRKVPATSLARPGKVAGALNQLRFFHSRQNALGRERRFAQANADGVEDRVGDGRGDRRAGRLAAAEGGHLRAVDQDDFDFRNGGETYYRGGVPIEGGDAGG